MIRVDFNRALGTATCDGLIAWGSDAYFDICRMAVERGDADGPAVFVDERGMACIVVQSVHSCARRYRPTEAEAAARKATIEAGKKIKAK